MLSILALIPVCGMLSKADMKTIRLNGRYRLYKEHGYQVGLKFVDYYTTAGQAKVAAVETACRKIFGNSGWYAGNSDWTSYR